MPVPKWMAKVNKSVLNPRELKRGERPVLRHVGRSSGRAYRTPLDAHPVSGGYLFFLVYGTDSDWVRNILAAGSATLEIDGREIELDSPELVSREAARQLLPADEKAPKVSDVLSMKTAAA